MVHRDPQTGQFVAGDDTFDDVEIASFRAVVGVEASNLGGGTGFGGGDIENVEGTNLLDYDEIVDRNESLTFMQGWHRATVFSNSTSTEDGTVEAQAEISTSPAKALNAGGLGGTLTGQVGNAVGNTDEDDTIDLIGRQLHVVGHSPFSDTTNGMGGGGSAGEDNVYISALPGEARQFHPRDDLFLNANLRAWNIDDAGIHLAIEGQHHYGVSTM